MQPTRERETAQPSPVLCVSAWWQLAPSALIGYTSIWQLHEKSANSTTTCHIWLATKLECQRNKENVTTRAIGHLATVSTRQSFVSERVDVFFLFLFLTIHKHRHCGNFLSLSKSSFACRMEFSHGSTNCDQQWAKFWTNRTRNECSRGIINDRCGRQERVQQWGK